MSNTAARKSYRATDRLPVDEARKVRADQAREFEQAQKATVWSRAKSAAKKVGGFFKAIGRKVASTTTSIGRKVATTTKVVFHKVRLSTPVLTVRIWAYRAYFMAERTVVRTARFVARNWATLLAGAVLLTLLILAPLPVVLGAVLITLGVALVAAGGTFIAVLIGRVLIEIGMQVIVEGLFNRNNR